MKNPDGEHPIQSSPSKLSPFVPFECSADHSLVKDPLGRGEKHQRSLLAGVVFGALVGLPLGAVASAACCLLMELFDLLWHGVLIGSLTGPFGGAILAFTERKIRGDLIRPDIATFIGIVYGLLPALLTLLGGMGMVSGNLSGRFFIGSIFIFPMIGMLIGGILDRAFETMLKKSWSTAMALGLSGLAVCGGLLYGIDAAAYGPEPKDVIREARAIILTRWENQLKLRNATINTVTLVRKGRRMYTGFVDATIDDRSERLDLEVVVENGMISLRLTPINE